MALARTASCANCRQTVIPGAVSDAKEPREHSLEALCREASSMQEMEGVASGVVRRARRKSAESKRRATGPGKPRAVQNARGASGETSATGEPLEKRIEDFIAAAREDILARTRTIVAERSFPRASCDEIENGLPLLLDQVSERLCRSHPNGAVASGAAKHGRELLQMGMSVTHVVHDFADIRRAVVDLAAQVNSSLAVTELLAIDRALDDVVAHTVAEYSRQRERAAAREAAERLGVVAHETRNHLGTAMLAFSSLEEGRGDAQRSRAILGRSLRRLMNLVERSFAEVRLESGVRRPQQVSISNLVGEIASGVPVEDIVFEAPTKNAQAWFIKQFGPAVNLGNIAPDEVIPLETLRRGLRGDTLKEVLLGDRAGTPAS